MHASPHDAMWQNAFQACTHTHAAINTHLPMQVCVSSVFNTDCHIVTSLPFFLHNTILGIHQCIDPFGSGSGAVNISYSTSLVGLLKLYVTYASYVLLLTTYVGTVGTLLKLTFRPLVYILKVNCLMFI